MLHRPNQGASAAELVSTKALGTKVGVIYDSSDDYSSGLYKGFSDKAAELGLEIVATTSFTADNKADLSTQVTQCQDAGADLVFLPIYYTEAAQILSYANKIGYAPKFFGCDGMDGILTVEGFDTSLAEGLALMTPPSMPTLPMRRPSPSVPSSRRRWMVWFPTSSPLTAMTSSTPCTTP